MLKHLAGLLLRNKWSEFWRTFQLNRWKRRIICHKSIACCQYIDRPNDNNPGGK